MFGIFFLYFLGKKFYELADKFGQNKWLFAIISVVMYYASGFLLGAILLIIGELIAPGFVDGFSETSLNLIVIPIGLLACWGFYVILERKWKNAVKIEISSIDDIGRISEE